MKKRALSHVLLKIIGLVLTVLTFLIVYTPILVIMVLSFNDSLRGYGWEGFTLRWYVSLFQSSPLTQPILNTVSIAICSTAATTVLGTIFAIGINSLDKKNRIRMVIMNNIPVVSPDIVTGISLMIVFSLLSFTLGFPTVLIAHIFFSLPYVILSILPRLKKLDPNLYEAGLDLGCSRAMGVWKVIIPNISTGILAGALMAFTMSIDDFVITYFTSGDEYMNVSTWLYSALKRGRSFTPAAYAYNVIIFLITIAIIVTTNLIKERKERKHEKAV
jgi:spermidine/putrescine transport system permease protein